MFPPVEACPECMWENLEPAVLSVRGAKVGLTHCTGGGISGFDHGVCSIHLFAR